MVTEVIVDVFAVTQEVADGRNAVIFGSRGAAAIDTGISTKTGQEMLDLIRDREAPACRLLYTHGHGDHILGSLPFKGCEVYAPEKTVAVMMDQCRAVSHKNGIALEDAKKRVLWPTVMYSDELTIDLGGKTLKCFPTPGHSDDHVSIYVPEDRLLVAGDTVVTSIVPAFFMGNSRLLERSLERILGMDIEVMIVGHGAPMHGKEVIEDWIRWVLGYLRGLRREIRTRLDRDEAPEEIADALTFEQWVGDRLPADKFGMPKRHRTAVEKIIKEEAAVR